MELTYTLNSFNPAFAHDIDCTGQGIMFDYTEPEFIAHVTTVNGGKAPHDVTISLSDTSVALYVCFDDAEEPEDCLLLINHQAGRDMLTWVGHEVYGHEGAELAAYIQRVLLGLAYEPTDTGGVVFDDLNGMERQLMYEAYQFITA